MIWIDVISYDVSNFKRHPGGTNILKMVDNRDCTDMFYNIHSKNAIKMLKKWKTTTSENPPKINKVTEDYRKLKKKFTNLGLFKPKNVMYVYDIVFCLIISIMIPFFLINNYSILAGMSLALFWHQLALLSHDLGHNSIFNEKKNNSSVGLIMGNLLFGTSIGWWKYSHNIHHALTNEIENDPDIQHYPFLATDKQNLKEYKSKYSNSEFRHTVLTNTIVKFQHILYYLILCFGKINMYIESFAYCIRKKKNIEIIMLICHLYIIYNLCLLTQSPILFIATSHIFSAVLHVQITLSHFAEHKNISKNFVEQQILSSLNITAPKYMYWFHGGLEYQIEHHLFPQLPKYNLHIVAPHIKKLCSDNNIPYKSLSFYDANKKVISHLYNVVKNLWY